MSLTASSPEFANARQFLMTLVVPTPSNSASTLLQYQASDLDSLIKSLVFMGSRKYPHKGLLDILANRGFSNGTNAWTDQDHTAYTISTAGEQGFLQLLPIYVDHILFPTLTEAGYVLLLLLSFLLTLWTISFITEVLQFTYIVALRKY